MFNKFYFTNFATSLLALFFFAALPAVPCSSAELSSFTFKTHTFWVTIPGKILDRQGRMIFRRFSVLADNDGKIDFDIGMPNTMMFWCSKNSPDVLVFHLHDSLTLKSFRLDSWEPKLDINILRDTGSGHSLSSAYKGEYIKGDIFIDLTRDNAQELVSTMESSDVVIDFGDAGDQIHYEVMAKDKSGANINGFLSEMMKEFLAKEKNGDMSQFQPLETKDMLARCMKFRKTGR